jgi:cyclopropane-fatty-acyl-phospholipid synthase
MNFFHHSVPDIRDARGKHAWLQKFFSSIDKSCFTVTYWNGVQETYGAGESHFDIIFHTEPKLLEMLASPSLFFGEAIMRGEIELQGSYRDIARALVNIPCEALPKHKKLMNVLSHVARTLKQQKSDIAAHYDLGNDFFSLWLDKTTMNYSCAYFRNDNDTLDEAQLQKVDLILRKLFIKPGMTLLDIGCGWGTLAITAAKKFGAKVLAITLSEEQAKTVTQRIKDEGLSDRCKVSLENYLELDGDERFDRICSVGMFEHVGLAHYQDYFKKVTSLLKKDGVTLLHTLTKLHAGQTDPWIEKYIFPGGYIPALTEVMPFIAERSLRVLSIEDLGRHYVKTLDIWFKNFSQPNVQEFARSKFGEPFIRMWGLYLRMASAFIANGDVDVHQLVLAKGNVDALPMTMESVYSIRN